jgi:hypothetical protein
MSEHFTPGTPWPDPAQPSGPTRWGTSVRDASASPDGAAPWWQHGEEVRSMEPLYPEIGRTVRYAIAKRDRTACLCALMVVGAAIYALLLFIG